jgi:F0F1-type ATP synthase delta subunit
MDPEHTVATSTVPALHLPVSVVGPVDIGRLQREVESIDNFFQAGRLKGDAEVKLPKTSHLLDQLAEANGINLSEEDHRQLIAKYLTAVKTKAPRLHMSFSADPSTQFIEKLMVWLRREISPHVLLTIGLQPSIGAGCVVRTTSKYFDLSLAKNLTKQSNVLIERLRGGTI